MSKQKLIPELRFPEFVKEVEWEKSALENLGQFLGGGTPDRSNSDYWIGNIPWISSSDISEDDIHNISITRFINDNAVKQSATKIVPKGSILFVSRVGVGKLAINKEGICTSQDFTSFIPNSILNYFIGYYFSANKQLLQSLNQGTSIKGFSKSDLENFELIYPKNHKEQQKIASCLSSLDEVIAAHNQKLEALKDHKKGMMQNFFPQEGETVPKWRFKEFEKDGEWVEKMLWQIAAFVNEKTQLENLSINSYVSTENLLPDYAGVSIASKLPTSGNCTIYRKGDVLISNIRPYLKKVWFADKDGACSNDVIVVQAKSIITNTFLSCLLKNDAFINYIMKGAEGVKMPRGDKDSIKEYSILFPKEKSEQQKIASCLSSLDELITAQAEKIEVLKLHKKGLMQGLFPKKSELPTYRDKL